MKATSIKLTKFRRTSVQAWKVPLLAIASISVAILFFGLFAFKINTVQQEVDELIEADRDQSLWTATQVETELLEFQIILLEQLREERLNTEVIKSEFDIMYARLSQATEPTMMDTFNSRGLSDIPTEFLTLRDEMAQIVDTNPSIDEESAVLLINLASEAVDIWTSALGYVLQDARDYKISVRSSAATILQNLQITLWLTAALSTVLPIVAFAFIKLKRQHNAVLKEKLKDQLTGCATREGLNHAIRFNAAQYRNGVAVAVIDIDNLKLINDTYGHRVGDTCIQKVGEALTRVTRGYDCAARIGGDEFVVLLDATEEQAKLIMSRAEEFLAQDPVIQSQNELSISVSIGVAECVKTTQFDVAFDLADQRMYAKKILKKSQTA